MPSERINLKKNSGVLIARPKPSDFLVAGESGIVYETRNTSGEWGNYLPTEEKQVVGNIETMACVTFSGLNVLETQLCFLLETAALSQAAVLFLTKNGYLDSNGKPNFSDRFTAYMSGTTHNGNYLTNVWGSIRNDGALPECDWPAPSGEFNWDAYYSDPGAERKAKAKKFLEIFDIKYEWVASGEPMTPGIYQAIKTHLKQAPLQVAAPTCPPWATTDIIHACGSTVANHATEIYGSNGYIEDFDHYIPFRKKLAADYFLPYVIKGVLTEKKPISIPPPEAFHYVWNTNLFYSNTSNDIKALQRALKISGCFPSNVIESGFYGEITRTAVLAFQKKYKVASIFEILVLKGKKVGPKTRQRLNSLFH